MASAGASKEALVGDVGDEDPLLSGVEELRKAFVPLSFVLESAQQKQERHHVLRELQFLLLFFVTLLPFILVQSQTSAFFESKLMFEQLLLETPFAPKLALWRNESVSTANGAPFNGTVQLPFLSGPDLDQSAAVESKIRFADISGPDSFWSWMHQVVALRLVLPQFCHISKSVAPVDSFWVFNDSELLRGLQRNYTQACLGAELPRFVLLNGIRIRQVAVLPRRSCSPFLEPVPSASALAEGLSEAAPFNESAASAAGLDEDFFTDLQVDPGLCYPAYAEGQPAQSSLRWGRFIFSSYFPPPSSASAEINSTFVYAWQQQSVLQSSAQVSHALGPVTGDGFPVVLPLVNSSFYSVVNRIFQYATSIVSRGENGRPLLDDALPFVGRPVRALYVSIPTYNPSNNIYAQVRASFYVGPTGSWSNTLQFSQNQPLGEGLTTRGVSAIVFGALAVLYVLAYVGRFVRHFNAFRHGNVFVLVELALVVCYLATVYFIVSGFIGLGMPQAAQRVGSGGEGDSLVDPLWVCPVRDEEGTPNANASTSGFAPCGGAPPFVSLDSFENRDTAQILFATTVLLVAVRMVALLIRFRRFRILYATISYARLNLAYYFIIYLVIYLGFFLSGYLYYSYDLERFSSLSSSALTVLLWFGKSANDAVAELNAANSWAWVFGPLFFISFVFIFNWVFAAVLLAVIYNAFSAVKDAAFARETDKDVLEAELARLGML